MWNYNGVATVDSPGDSPAANGRRCVCNLPGPWRSRTTWLAGQMLFFSKWMAACLEIDVPLPKWILIFSRILGSHESVCEMIFLSNWESKLPCRKTTSASHFHCGETCNVRSGKPNFLVAYLMRCQEWEPGIYCRCISTWALTTCKNQIFPQNP